MRKSSTSAPVGSSAWARTDYRFVSREEADALAVLFFGETFAYEPGPDGSVILPECTGLWWRRKDT